MVWFQCEDCGENLRKPKLLNHFRKCSANKLSCIDCGQMFGQQSVQAHTQCITEAEKYGPKGQGKASNNTPAKAKNDKQKPEVDVNVGLSSRHPWFCSLCNTNATSKQALLIHAEGKKHRAKARAFHASKQQPTEEGSTPAAVGADPEQAELVSKIDEAVSEEKDLSEPTCFHNNKEAENGSLSSKEKRKLDASDMESAKSEQATGNSLDLGNGELVQAKRLKESEGSEKKPKHNASAEETTNGNTKESKKKTIKWKKLIASVLKSSSDETMKMRKLEKAILKSLHEAGLTEDADQLKQKLMQKINSSPRFRIDNKIVRLVSKSSE